MRSAMMLGRPLPPRLASAAVQYAPTLQSQAWLGYLLLTMGVPFVAMGAVQIFLHGFPWWESAGYEVAGGGLADVGRAVVPRGAAGWAGGTGRVLARARRGGRMRPHIRPAQHAPQTSWQSGDCRCGVVRYARRPDR